MEKVQFSSIFFYSSRIFSLHFAPFHILQKIANIIKLYLGSLESFYLPARLYYFHVYVFL